MSTPVLQNQSPFKKPFHTTPDYTFLKIFECACYPNLRPYNSHKFSPRSKECVFLGYSQNHKGYKCLHLESDRMYISRDIIFHEDRFPFSKVSPFLLCFLHHCFLLLLPLYVPKSRLLFYLLLPPRPLLILQITLQQFPVCLVPLPMQISLLLKYIL